MLDVMIQSEKHVYIHIYIYTCIYSISISIEGVCEEAKRSVDGVSGPGDLQQAVAVVDGARLDSLCLALLNEQQEKSWQRNQGTNRL